VALDIRSSVDLKATTIVAGNKFSVRREYGLKTAELTVKGACSFGKPEVGSLELGDM